MRASIYILAAVAVAGFATAGAQNTGNPATPPRTQTPVRQPTTSPPAARQMPSPQVTTPTPAQATQPTQPSSTTQPMQSTQPMQPAQPMPINPNSTAQQTVFPPDSRIDPNNPANNPAQRLPPASRGVGKPGRPDCSQMRGLEKSECERRDTTRDDLPAGVTTKQPEK